MKAREILYRNQQSDDLINYILGPSLNESISDESSVLTKLKEVAKKGLLTAMLVCAVMPSLSANGRAEATNIARDNGIEVSANPKGEERRTNIITIRVCVAADNIDDAKRKSNSEVVKYCHSINEKDAKLIDARVVYSGQSAKIVRQNGVETSTKSQCGALIEYLILTRENHGDDIIKLTVK